jgi:predicted nucleic acid-binding protein
VIVVSDTSCLRYLALAGLEMLLPELFGKVLIPPTVAKELAAGAARIERLAAIADAPWIVVAKVEFPDATPAVSYHLDPGEREALALAWEKHATLLVDDLAGRKQAALFDLKHIGTLGILVAARQRKLVGPLKPIFEDLVDRHSFRASEELIRRTLKSVGE